MTTLLSGRVYLDVIGVIPSADSSRRFVADRSPGKRAALVDALLARNDEYAAHWTPFWEEALASQPSDGRRGTHGDYSDFIYESFRANKPFDLMVAELLDPAMPGHKKSTLANANGKINVIGFVRNQTQRHHPNGGQHGAGFFGDGHEMRQLPQPFPEQGMAAGALHGVRRAFRQQRSGVDSLRGPQRPFHSGRLSLRSAGRANRAGRTWTGGCIT